MNVLFVDRDGTLVQEPPDEQVDSFEKLAFIPGVVTGLGRLVRHGYKLVMVTNQDHLGTPRFPFKAFEPVQQRILDHLAGEGIRFDAVFVCPHVPEDNCACRKPKTGLLEDFMRSNPVDLKRSWVIGDRETDVQLARNLQVRAARLTRDAGSAADITRESFLELCNAIVHADRSARVVRSTKETTITVEIALDGTGRGTIRTGIGFFDHMLEQIAKHSGIDLTIDVKGDLRVDEHHTVEDTGIALGEAIRQALGEKRGIGRYGFVLPMDESLAQVALDLGGRPYCAFNATFTRERVGELPTELVEDFFRAFADGLRANLHITVNGRNDHHQIEAMFKATARALRQAIALDGTGESIPSTKGVL